jgi:hypothetical protein
MPGTEFLDSLVKIASLGASGICIFAIFWIGWLIWRPPAKPDPGRHKTLRLFMLVSIIIALISAATGVWNAMFNREVISRLEAKNQEQVNEINKITDDLEKCKTLTAEKTSHGAPAGPVKVRLNVNFEPNEVNPRNPNFKPKAFIKTPEGDKPVPIQCAVREGALSVHVDVPDMETPFFIVFETPKGIWMTDDYSIKEAPATARKQGME